MRNLFVILTLIFTFCGDHPFQCYAQESTAAEESSTAVAQDSVVDTKKDSKLILIDIPKKMKIEDKIKLVNNTQTTILQAAVVLVNEDGSYSPLATIGTVHPGYTIEMASFNDEWLKKIRGRTIGVKVKGIKKTIAGRNTTTVSGGVFPIGVGRISVDKQDIDASALEQLTNPDEELITYKYFAHIHEDSHDLFITLTEGEDALDF